MFVRKVTRTENRKKHVYLEIFDQQPTDGKESQPVARLGPVNRPAGELDVLVRAMRQFCKDTFVSRGEISAQRILSWGPVLVARHLWEEMGVADAVSAACNRGVAEAAFALTANRLIEPSWECGMDHWLEKVYMPGQPGHAPETARVRKSPRKSGTRPDSLWDSTLRRLAAKRRVIQTALLDTVKGMCGIPDGAVLYELDSSFVEKMSPGGPFMGWPAQGSRRTMRLHLGAIVCDGWPLSIRFYGGGEPSGAQIKRFIEESQRRFALRNVLFVAPSGTDEAKLIQLESLGFHYMVGVRRRRDPKAVEVIEQAGRQWVKIDANTRVQEVLLPVESDVSLQAAAASEIATERYFLVHSRQEEKEERALRTSVVSRALKTLGQLQRGVENGRFKKPTTIMARAERILAERKGYRYISWRVTPQGGFEFWEAEQKSTLRRAYEGISLVKTSDADISPSSAVVVYEGLRRLQNAFLEIRDTAAFRSTRLPLPELEESPANGEPGNLFWGHLFVTQLAFLLQCRLEKRLLEQKLTMSLGDAIEALKSISVAELRLGGEKHMLVSRGDRTASKIVRALGIDSPEPTADTRTGKAQAPRK